MEKGTAVVRAFLPCRALASFVSERLFLAGRVVRLCAPDLLLRAQSGNTFDACLSCVCTSHASSFLEIRP